MDTCAYQQSQRRRTVEWEERRQTPCLFFTMRELEDGTVQETHTSVIREKIRMMLFTPSMSRHQSRLEKEREKNRRVWVVLMWGFERQDGPSGLGRCKASLFF
jgi:hypothetical protein